MPPSDTLATIIDETQFEAVRDAILTAKRVLVAGAGRSGFIARGFANRLLHLGIDVAFVGEPTTPPITDSDLLVVISGSGRTTGLVAMAERAHSLGTPVATITADPNGPIGRLAATHLTVPGNTRLGTAGQAGAQAQPASIQPVGTIFEQLAWLSCDAIVVLLRDRTDQTNDDLVRRHANLE